MRSHEYERRRRSIAGDTRTSPITPDANSFSRDSLDGGYTFVVLTRPVRLKLNGFLGPYEHDAPCQWHSIARLLACSWPPTRQCRLSHILSLYFCCARTHGRSHHHIICPGIIVSCKKTDILYLHFQNLVINFLYKFTHIMADNFHRKNGYCNCLLNIFLPEWNVDL